MFLETADKKGGFLNKNILTFSENKKIPPRKGLKSLVDDRVIRYITGIPERVYGVCHSDSINFLTRF